jgi:small subunit ribosomal protein S3Ae
VRRLARKRQKDKWKAKGWYTLLAPKMFGTISVGDTVASDPSKLIGRKAEITLDDLTGNRMKGQNLKLLLKICDVDHNTAYTKLVGHEMDRDYLRGLVRRRSSKIESNINVTTKDGRDIRVKSSCFTLKKVSESQVKLIRKVMEDIIRDRANILECNKYMQEIILGKLASDIYMSAKKIHPLRRAEINKTEIGSISGSGSDQRKAKS